LLGGILATEKNAPVHSSEFAGAFSLIRFALGSFGMTAEIYESENRRAEVDGLTV
jgi:hypothetical protein